MKSFNISGVTLFRSGVTLFIPIWAFLHCVSRISGVVEFSVSDQLTKNFSAHEFRVSSSFPEIAQKIAWTAFDEYKAFLISDLYLEKVRAHIDAPVSILSGKRSRELNFAVGGAEKSDHLFEVECAACDFTFTDDTKERVFRAYEFLASSVVYFGQIIYYPEKNFIHISLPSRRHMCEVGVNSMGKLVFASNE